MIRAVVAILVAAVLPTLSAMAGPFETITNLELKEPSGIPRANWPVTTGVPLPEGALENLGDAVLLDTDGKPVPAQFEVLSRWIPGDGSVRWLLVDTQASLEPGELATFTLARGRLQGSRHTSLRVEETEDAVTITTPCVLLLLQRSRRIWY